MSSTSLQMLSICAATIAQISTQLLNATVGGSVLIPCSLPGYQLSLTWFYWQESGNLVFHWDSKQNPQPVAEKYKNRCQVFETEFTSGNISIRLDKVTVEDDVKTFRVYVRWYDEQKKVPKTLENWCQSKLQVSAPYQHLDLTVNSTANRATCTARGGYPKPQIFWTGRNKSSTGQLDLQDAETSLQQDPTRKTFTFTSSVSVKELQSVTCCIRNPPANQCVDKTVKIDVNQQETNYWPIGIIVTFVIIFISTFICLWCHRERRTCDCCSQQTGTETPPPASDRTVSLSRNQATYRCPTVSTEGATADPPGAAAGEQKEKLLKKGNGDEARSSESVKDK